MNDRPSPQETDDDLIKQDELFKSQVNTKQSSKPTDVKVQKRKNEECLSSSSKSENFGSVAISNEKKITSKFAAKQSKKKKQGIVDNTVLNEAVKKNENVSCVMQGIVAREVPTVSSNITWQPLSNTNGFPQAPKLESKYNVDANASCQDGFKRSLYMTHMQKNFKATVTETPEKTKECVDDKLSLLGPCSFIVSGKSGLGKVEEAEKIHAENLEKMRNMSHEERLKERNELMSNLDPKQVEFLLSLRKGKMDIISKSNFESASSCQQNMEEMDVDESHSLSVHPTEAATHTDISDQMSGDETKIKEYQKISLPVSQEDTSKWLHMNKIEYDKLKWMSEIPKPKALKSKQGFIARFNFEGDLLPYDSDVSWREGLHHHGDEPGRAGYSVDELFIFVRSQVVQQRHVGLKTLANILRNASEGLYDECFDVSLLEILIDSGIVLLLRFALDDKTTVVYQEALRGLYYLVSCEADEKCLSVAEPWSPLCVQPGFSSSVHTKEKTRKEIDEDENELKDVELIKLDVIKALMRMDILPRFRYLLESVFLSPSDVIHLLGILRRIARHSLTNSWTIVQTPRIISSIFDHFIPHDFSCIFSGNSTPMNSVYGVPLSQALSLFKVLASRGRAIASKLLNSFDILSRIMAYVSQDPNEHRIPHSEALAIVSESYLLWSVFLSYGLMKAQEGFSEYYPLFVKQLLFYRDKVDLTGGADVATNHFNCELGSHLIHVLTKGLAVAATRTLLVNRMRRTEGSTIDAKGKEIVLQPPILTWELFDEIANLVEVCLVKWVSQLEKSMKDVSFSGFKLVGSCCKFFEIYLSKWRDQNSFEGVRFVKKIEYIHSVLASIFSNVNTRDFLLTSVNRHSSLCSRLKLGDIRESPNMTSLRSICRGGEVVPVLQKESPFPLLVPLSSLLLVVYSSQSKFENDFIGLLFEDDNFLKYLSDICSSSLNLSSQYFTRGELYFASNLLQISSIVSEKNSLLFHQVALIILPLVHKGDEFHVKKLMENLICNVMFYRDVVELDKQFENLTISDFKPLKSPAFSQPVLSTEQLTNQALASLQSAGQDFIINFVSSSSIEVSLMRNGCVPFLINDLFLDRSESISVLDEYWCLGPLNLLLALSASKTRVENITDPSRIISITKWLQVTYILLKYRKCVTLTRTSRTGWFWQLSNVFTCSNDLFLNPTINSYVQASFFELIKKDSYRELDWSFSEIEGQSFEEWYKQLLEQFSSVAYGDASFSLFLIVPLLRHWPARYRALLFSEHSDSLMFIRLTEEEVSQFFPTEAFYYPREDELELKTKYTLAMRNNNITETRNPFLFKFVQMHLKNVEK